MEADFWDATPTSKCIEIYLRSVCDKNITLRYRHREVTLQ